MNLTENLNYVKREYDNYNKININNHYNINYQQHSMQQHYNIRENFNITENPSEKQPQRNNYLGGNGEEHYNNFRMEHEPLLTNQNVMPKVLYRAEQTSKYEPPQYVGIPFQRSLQPMTHDARYRHYQPQQSSSSQFYHPQQQQQQQQQPYQQQFYQPQYVKKQTNSAPYRTHHTSNNNSAEVYMKPLPKLPPHNENESREMSSTDDLSQSEHRQSLSVDSSSDESYSKTDDFDQSNLNLDMPKINSAAPLTAEQQKRMPALKDLQDYEISSTTDHTVSTLPHHKGESCNSFEFQNDKRELLDKISNNDY
jgi:hypothetical protein